MNREEIILKVIDGLKGVQGTKHATELFNDEEGLIIGLPRLKEIVGYMKIKGLVNGINYMGADELLIGLSNSTRVILEEHGTYINYLNHLKKEKQKKTISTALQVAHSVATLAIAIFTILVTIKSNNQQQEIDKLRKVVEGQEFVIKSLQSVKQ